MESPTKANVSRSPQRGEDKQDVEFVGDVIPMRNPSPPKVPRAPRSRVAPVPGPSSEALGVGPSRTKKTNAVVPPMFVEP